MARQPASDALSPETVAPVQGTAATDPETVPVLGTHAGAGDQALIAVVDDLNSKIQNLNRNLEFAIDEDSGDLVVKVVDAKTHEVIRQIPRKEALQLAKSIDQYMQDHHIGLVKTGA